MITPTVGRVVWIRNRHGSIDKRQPEVGFITYVHSDRCINVAGFDGNGMHFWSTSVPLKQDDYDPTAGGGYWAEWMPYQKGQAAKTEALEKQIGSGG